MSDISEKTSGFVRDLGDAARQNPLSAALIGMGVLWLFTGGRTFERAGDFGGRSGLNRIPNLANDAFEAARSTVRSGADAIGESVGSARDALKDSSAAALDNATRIDIGFRSRGLIMMSVDPRLHGYSPDRIVQFLALVRERISALPGVVTASYTDAVPLSGGHRSESFQIEGDKVEGGIGGTNTELYMVAHGYFETMGIERKAGRDFTDGIGAGAKVAVVNEAFAQALFSKENPLGQRVHGGGQTYEIIGVVKDTKSRTIGEKQRPVLFRSLEQTLAGDPSFSGYTILVRYSGGHGGLINAMRREIGALDPSLAVFKVATMEEHLRDALFLPRLAGTLFGVFGFIGLTLAAVGLYGLISYRVSRRLKEIGIRLAIGANVRAVQFLIIRQGMTLALIALVPGLVAAWALSKLFTNFLYGIAPNDMVSFTVAPAFLVLIAFLASWIPSRRAAKVNPSNTMRHE